MPRPPRFFISPDQISGPRISITGGDVRHIATVLRMKTGDGLLLCDGEGTEYAVKITDVERSAITTEITGQSKRELRYPRITLGQGLPKSDKMDLIIQKATELGAAGIIPFVTERVAVKVRDGEKRIARWQKIAKEAAMQSNRPDVPKVLPIRRLADYLRAPDPPRAGTLLLLPWEEGTEPIRNVLRRNPALQNIVVLIGPEGGFSTAEAESARTRGFHPVSLGPNILRTETAAIAVLSMLGYEYF